MRSSLNESYDITGVSEIQEALQTPLWALAGVKAIIWRAVWDAMPSVSPKQIVPTYILSLLSTLLWRCVITGDGKVIFDVSVPQEVARIVSNDECAPDTVTDMRRSRGGWMRQVSSGIHTILLEPSRCRCLVKGYSLGKFTDLWCTGPVHSSN